MTAMRPTGDNNWEISISSPTNLETIETGDSRENLKLSPRPMESSVTTENIETDDCWMINIKSPATLSVTRADTDDSGFQVNSRILWLLRCILLPMNL